MKKKLLLVDDEKFFLEGLRDGLKEFEDIFTTDICFSVEEAKKLQKKNTYDLIVSDIRMPKKSGLDLFIYLRKRKFKGGFIAMTAYGTEDLLKNIRELGGLDIIMKPFNLEWFKDKIIEYFQDDGVSGTIESIDLTSLLQMVNLEKKSVTVKIVNKDMVGFIYFEKGEIIHAEYNEFEGLEAAKYIISLNKGKFSISKNGEVVPRSIDVPFVALMMDSMKFNDEKILENKTKEKENKMDVEKLNACIEIPKSQLGEGLLATDIFGAADGQSLAGFNPQPAASALFNKLSDFMIEALDSAGFPPMGRYYTLSLDDNKMVIVTLFGDYRWGMLIDGKKAQLGLLLNVVMPKMIKALEEALAE
ncbi:MAG: response regulator [Acidobacteriota bacterium]